MQTVKGVRELEQLVITDQKQANSILPMQKAMREAKPDVQLASLHSLRRVFLHLIGNGQLSTLIATKKRDTADLQDKVKEYRKWLSHQLLSYQDFLLNIISSGNTKLQVPAIKTMLEFVKQEYKLSKLATGPSWFGVKTYLSLMNSIIRSTEIDIDILLMLRQEVFDKHDCTYYALLIIREELLVLKNEAPLASSEVGSESETVAQPQVIQNCLDLLRILNVPPEIDAAAFLVNGSIEDDGLEGDSDAESDSDDDGDPASDKKSTKAVGGKQAASRGSLGKRAGGSGAMQQQSKKKKQKKLSRAEQLQDLHSYRKAFTKAWLALLSLRQLTMAQHKLILRHLPEHVMGNVDRPLLLADYLSQGFALGGVVAVLALESLFDLILKHNLDYPEFFVCLYRLCNLEVFSAKYRGKFMSLLSASLKSTNLPAYLVAAFIKRLATLALHVPSPCALFCVAQLTWLLKEHPQCIVLLHRSIKSSGLESGSAGAAAAQAKEAGRSSPESGTARAFAPAEVGGAGGGGLGLESGRSASLAGFDMEEETDLARAGALQSSLWELLALREHHLRGVSALAAALEAPASTASGINAGSAIRVEDFIEHSYADLMEAELKRTKKCAALAYLPPQKLLDFSDFISQCFGSSGSVGER